MKTPGVSPAAVTMCGGSIPWAALRALGAAQAHGALGGLLRTGAPVRSPTLRPHAAVHRFGFSVICRCGRRFFTPLPAEVCWKRAIPVDTQQRELGADQGKREDGRDSFPHQRVTERYAGAARRDRSRSAPPVPPRQPDRPQRLAAIAQHCCGCACPLQRSRGPPARPRRSGRGCLLVVG